MTKIINKSNKKIIIPKSKKNLIHIESIDDCKKGNINECLAICNNNNFDDDNPACIEYLKFCKKFKGPPLDPCYGNPTYCNKEYTACERICGYKGYNKDHPACKEYEKNCRYDDYVCVNMCVNNNYNDENKNCKILNERCQNKNIFACSYLCDDNNSNKSKQDSCLKLENMCQQDNNIHSCISSCKNGKNKESCAKAIELCKTDKVRGCGNLDKYL